MTETRGARVNDASAIAALHAHRIAEGFLVTLGPRFLRRLYRRLVLSPHGFVLVVDDAEGMTGFVAVAKDTKRFYGDFIRRDLPAVVAGSAPALLRAPRKVWETFRYGTASDAQLPSAEVLAIAVDARAEGRGLGRVLLQAAIAELRRDAVDSVRVVTAIDNLPALRMYERAGFSQRCHVEVHAGVAQVVLVWR